MAFLVTILAGFTTMIGTIPIIFKIRNQDTLIATALSFSAGVMITLSIIDLVPESLKYLLTNNTTIPSILLVLIFVVAGLLLSATLDNLLDTNNIYNKKLYKLGIISMLAIIIHNIPEGIATYISTTQNPVLGIKMAIAVSLHNIPEGIVIAIPIYFATNKKGLALLYTAVSALAEPLGAVIAFLFLINIINNTLMGMILSTIAGIMLHISFYELLPISKQYNNKKESTIAFFLGIIIMFICIFILH